MTSAVMVAGSASATTTTAVYVATSGSSTTGCSESSPCMTINEGVMAAYALEDLDYTSVTVHVAAGTYYENDDITVPSGDTLALEGEGAGSTIVDGSGSGTVFNVTSGVLIIDGFTIENGNGQGGGVSNDGVVTLTNDALFGDSATIEGGGVYNESGAIATLTNDTLSNDSSNFYGGAVYNDGTATLTNDTISNDSAGDGGGVYNDADGTATLSGDTLTNDVASDGGGVYNDGTATLTNDAISNDSAPTNYGGGVANNDIITLTNDTLSGDSAEYGGGVYNADSANLTNDTLFGDLATTEGGGVFNGARTATLTFDTLSNDTAPTGYGGGVYNLSGTATVANSILDVASCGGSIVDGYYNVESDTSCSFGSEDLTSNSSINLAASLAANGSSGPETLAIGVNSSAFEEVPAGACTITTTDERGEPRPGQMGQSACDAGAYEYQRAAPIRYQSQSIDFGPLASVVVTTTQVALSATATSGLAVTFSSTTPGVCTVSADTVSVLAIGTCSITASQTGNAFVTAAPDVTESFSVTAAPVPLPGVPVITATSPFDGRLRITLTSPASGATSYQYSLDGRAWVKLTGTGPFTLTGFRHVTVSVRLRGVNETGNGRASNADRVRVRS